MEWFLWSLNLALQCTSRRKLGIQGACGRMSALGQQRFCLREQSGNQNSVLLAHTHVYTQQTLTSQRCSCCLGTHYRGGRKELVLSVHTNILRRMLLFFSFACGVACPAAVSKLSAVSTTSCVSSSWFNCWDYANKTTFCLPVVSRCNFYVFYLFLMQSAVGKWSVLWGKQMYV